MVKSIPLSEKKLRSIIERYGTPFYLYDESGIIESVKKLSDAFFWHPNFKNYFAVKATPNPYILDILKKAGCGLDCSSLAELELAQMLNLSSNDVMFTSNNTSVEEFKKAYSMNAIMNLDDLSHIKKLEDENIVPELICFRFNPGSSRAGNEIIGDPKEAKFGLTKDQIFEAYKIMKEKGVRKFGIHTMVASNESDPKYFIETAKMLFELIVELSLKLNISFEFANLGGGIGIPYHPDDKEVDVTKIGKGIQELYQSIILDNGISEFDIVMECGRFITGPYGYLVSSVRNVAKKYKNYVGLDSSMSDLMRPGMYGAYHHITVLSKEDQPLDHVYDVTGSLCENNDKFAIDRNLPKIDIGDILIIYDTGAHGHCMGFTYNGKLRPKELLLKKDHSVKMIRREESMSDYFITLDFDGATFSFDEE